MHDIEREIIKITKYKVQRKFADRQDYLKSLFTAVQKLSDDDFDDLTDEAAIWANACVEAHNSQRDGDLPDFDEVAIDDDADDENEESSDDDEDEGVSEDDDDGEEANDSDNEDEDVVDDGGEPVQLDSDSDGSDDEETEQTASEDDEEVQVKPAKKKAKNPVKAKVEDPKPPKVNKGIIPKIKQKPLDMEEDVVLDKWGCMEGSKNSQALKMFEKGATAKEIKEAIGGTYYNILNRMVQQGHKLEKSGSVFKLTHMTEKPTKSAPVKKAKK